MTKKNKYYYIWTIGCQMNKSDSERVAAVLDLVGYRACQKESEADLIVIVTCSVRQSAEDRVYGKARVLSKLKIKNLKLKIILTGCMANRKDVQKKLAGVIDIFLDINNLTKLPELLGEKSIASAYFKILPKLQAQFKAYVPIMTGCNNFCAYCVVPYTRGPEKSRGRNNILYEIKELVKRGCEEITLLGQNVNSYREPNHAKDARNYAKLRETTGKTDFVRLLKNINKIPGDFWVRFVSLHPKDMTDELIKAVARLEKVCEYIHLPIQAGDNTVLKNMNRKYTRAHYLKLIKKIRKNIPNVAISTDVIVGFPGETREQFKKSVEVFKRAKFDMAYIAQYSPRPGTVAEKMKDNVSREEKKKRENELTKILIKTALENNKKYVGKVVPVLVESEKHDKNKSYYIGKTRTFKNVKFNGEKGLLGKFVEVEITDALEWGLVGKFYKNI